MSSQPKTSMPRCAASRANEFDDAIEWRCNIIRDVERNLHAFVIARQARAREASASPHCAPEPRARFPLAAPRSPLANSTLKAIRTSRAPIAIAPALSWRAMSPSSGNQSAFPRMAGRNRRSGCRAAAP